MDEPRHHIPWYKRPMPRWLPGWLVACLSTGVISVVTFEYALGAGDWKSRSIAFGFGFGFTLVVLSFAHLKTKDAKRDSIFPPAWVRMPVMAGVGVLVAYAWLDKHLRQGPPPNLPRPDYVVWLLWACGGWFGFRLLWIIWDVVRAVRNGGEMRPATALPMGLSLLAGALAGATAGYALVEFVWPQAQQGWRKFFAWAAVLPGLVVGVAFEMYFDWLQKRRIMTWLLSFRLPRFQKQLLSSDPLERAKAARAFFFMQRYAAPAVPDLITALKDESAEVRSQAALAIWSIRPADPQVPAAMRPLLRDSDLRVRIAAAGVLVELGTANASEVLPALTEGLMHPDDQFADSIAAGALAKLGPAAAPAVPALQAALWDRQPPNVGALDRIGEAGMQVLIAALTHPAASVREEAAFILGRKDDAAAAVPALRAALADEEENVRRAAAKALQQIDRHSSGEN